VWHDEVVRWRGAQIPILSALTLLVLAVGVYHAAGVTRADPDPAAAAAPRTGPPGPPTAYARVYATATGSPLAPGFLGLSFEYSALGAYTGADPAALDPAFVQLLRDLGRPLVLRIGGNSTDAT
jgi:hypothetical protein